MRQKSMSKNDPAERTVRDIRRKTRKQYTAEEKMAVSRKWWKFEDGVISG